MLREFFVDPMKGIICSTLVIKLISTECDGQILVVGFRFLAQF